MCNISFNVDHYKHSQEEYSQRKPNMDTYARNRCFFVAEGHLSEGITWRRRYEYLVTIHNTGRNGGGGAAPGVSPDQTRLCLGFAATSLSVQKISEFSSIERYPRRAWGHRPSKGWGILENRYYCSAGETDIDQFFVLLASDRWDLRLVIKMIYRLQGKLIPDLSSLHDVEHVRATGTAYGSSRARLIHLGR